MKYTFLSYEDKWTMVMEIADQKRDKKRLLHELVVEMNAAGPLSESMVDELVDELLDLDEEILTESLVVEMFEQKQQFATEAMLDELAAIGALATSIDKNTGRTLYRYDDTDPRARMIMKAMANNEVESVQ